MAFFKDHIITHKKNDKERKDKMQNQTQLFEMFEIAIYLHEQLSYTVYLRLKRYLIFVCLPALHSLIVAGVFISCSINSSKDIKLFA